MLKTHLTLITFLFLSSLLFSLLFSCADDKTSPSTNKYTVTFDSKGGSSNPSPQIITHGTTAKEPTPPTKTDFIFGGWTTDTNTLTPFYFTNIITSNTTLYAKWATPVTVTFNPKGGSPIHNQIIASNSSVTEPPAPAKDGYGFAGWFADSSISIPFYFTNLITSDTTLYAKWRIRPADKQALLNLINPAIAANSTTNLNYIDTSLITDISELFKDKTTFNGDISQWNTPSVTDMRSVFYNAKAFNQPISNWDTSKVKDMSWMFQNAEAFDQPIGNWNTSNVIDMSEMFWGANDFNQPISNWSTSNVTKMNYMFVYAISFNQPIDNWNISKVTDMRWMFAEAKDFNQNLQKWGVDDSVKKSKMFKDSGLQPANRPSWCTASCY